MNYFALVIYYVAAGAVGVVTSLVFTEAYADAAKLRVTLRGRRVAALLGLVMGIAGAIFLAHFYVDCDLRAGATSTCRVLSL